MNQMKNWTWLFGCLVIVALLGASLVDGASAGFQPAPVEKPTPTPQPEGDGVDRNRHPNYDSLAAKAKVDGSVAVIVGLNVSFKPEGRLAGQRAVVEQRGQIQSLQAAVLDRVKGYDAASVKRFKFIPYMALQVDSTALKSLASSSLVASIEEDVPVPPSLDASVPAIHADEAWAAGYTGAGQAVAILDTGVDSSHPFLSGRVVSEACYSTTDAEYQSVTVCPNGEESQTGPGAGVNCSVWDCGHGTHVAGIAAGDGDDFDGVAPGADIIAIQVFSEFGPSFCGWGSCVLSYTSDQILGLERVYELRNDFSIAAANMSLGGGRYTSPCDSEQPARKAAIETLLSAGIPTIVASGNDGYSDALAAPACISSAVSVGASTNYGSPDEAVAWFSNSAYFLDLFAPGTSIDSSVPGGGYQSWNGTSMAAPHVAGAWAILKEAKPSASVTETLTAIESMGVPIADPWAGIVKPRVDVMGALNYLCELDPPTLIAPVDGSSTSDITPYFEWATVSRATAYRIQVDDNSDFSSPEINHTGKDSHYTPGIGLAPGIHYWRVRGRNSAGNGPWSEVWSVTIQYRNISGYVRESGSTGISGVVMNGLYGAPSTDGNGYYSGWVSQGWSGAVIPQSPCYTFSPPGRFYSNVTVDQSGQDYTGSVGNPTISGYVYTSDCTTMPGVVMTGLPGNPSTDSRGYYSATVPCDWSGTVTPQKTGYSFDPPNRFYSDVNSNQSEHNWTATFAAGDNDIFLPMVMGDGAARPTIHTIRFRVQFQDRPADKQSVPIRVVIDNLCGTRTLLDRDNVTVVPAGGLVNWGTAVLDVSHALLAPGDTYQVYIKGKMHLSKRAVLTLTDGVTVDYTDPIVNPAKMLRSGDANNDDVADSADVAAILAYLGQTPSSDPNSGSYAADLNGDGAINLDDINLVMAAWGESGDLN